MRKAPYQWLAAIAIVIVAWAVFPWSIKELAGYSQWRVYTAVVSPWTVAKALLLIKLVSVAWWLIRQDRQVQEARRIQARLGEIHKEFHTKHEKVVS